MSCDIRKYSTQPDEIIVKEILEGCSELYAIIVERYKNKIFHTCIGFLHNKVEAEDLVQDIFLQVYVSLSTFKQLSSFATWIYKVAINAALNSIREKSRRSLLSSFTSILNYQSLYNENYHVPEENFLAQEEAERLKKILGSLPEKQRIAVILNYYTDLTQKEIANIMGTTEGAVESLLQRAKSNLRKKYGIYRRKD
ncbi:MAG: RNA polymerase sigma factor [Bacteroidales bacterium]|nr:RNA polymerase sigma factor [Bacteroidales bacterium]